MTSKVLYVVAGVALFAIVGVVGSIFGYQHYRISSLNNKIEEALGRDSGYTDTILKVEQEASRMNYKELFDLCDKSIENRTNLIVELRGLYPDIEYELKEEIINFLNNENELVRAKRIFYQKQLELSSTMTMLTELTPPSSYYAWDIYEQRRNKIKGELLKASMEMISSADDFSKSYEKLIEQESSLSPKMTNAGIRFNAIFNKYQESNSKAVIEAKKHAEDMKRSLTSKT